MLRTILWGVILVALGAGGWAAYEPAARYWKERNRVNYLEVEVTRGRIVAVVNSTGTVKPVRSVQVGSFVSGPIESILVDFNDEVKKGDLLAKIDPRIYEAAVALNRATLATRIAEVGRVKATLQQAINDEKRSKALRAERRDFISDSEMDQYKFGRMSQEAQLAVAQTTVKQAQANLNTSEANLAYTKITAPVDGVIIDRKVDPGQTVASQFQTPELFIVAPDMRKEMRVFASVDEADIGLIRGAQEAGQPVHFTVDAYPDDLFEGKIFQIRRNSTTTQNVVTYPVLVSAPNPDLKLLPGMTASLSFQVGRSDDAPLIPNAALRFFPEREQVRPEDRKLLEGAELPEGAEDQVEESLSAAEKAEARRRRGRRHVWVVDGDFLKAVEVYTGLSDSKFTELISGDIRQGRKLVTGIRPKE
jgi:HlyD family secretion protein